MAQAGDQKSSVLRRSRALVAFGGLIALVTGTFAAAAPAATPTDSDNADGENAVDNQVVSTGAYEACSENFGYGKVVEIVVKVDGTVPTPPLTFPTDVQVVAEFDDGAPQVCVPEVVTPALWDDESIWGNVIGIDAPPPVGNYVFLPDVECDTTFTMRLVGAPAGYTVTVAVDTVAPPEMAFPFFGCGTYVDALPFAEPLMSVPAFTALTSFVEADYSGQGCNDDGTGTPNADLAAAATALVGDLEGRFAELYTDASAGDTVCENVASAFQIFALQTAYESEVGRQAIFELTTPPPPPAPPAPPVIEPTFTG